MDPIIEEELTERIICPREAHASTFRLIQLDSTYLPHDSRQASVGLVATGNRFNTGHSFS